MARRVQTNLSVEQRSQQMQAKIAALLSDLNSLSLREKVSQLVDVRHDLSCLCVTVLTADGFSRSSAKNRLQTYLQQNVGSIVAGVELSVVSGISDYPRRIRQLRVEDGFKIATGASPDPFSGVDLRPDEYLLTEFEPDAEAAQRWTTANSIRRRPIAVQQRILEFLMANVGKIVTTEELAYVARDRREFGRRTRELRTEQGYAVATHYSGRPDLSRGEYILLSSDRIAEAHDRHIPDDVQKEVYARDQNTCRNPSCRYQFTRSDPRILELHHIREHARGGENIAANLMVLCSRCHDEVHAGRLNIFDCLVS